MFAAPCPANGAPTLLTLSRVTRITRLSGGFRLNYTCWCGLAGAHVVPSVGRGSPRYSHSGR